jgi:hypothetical protein
LDPRILASDSYTVSQPSKRNPRLQTGTEAGLVDGLPACGVVAVLYSGFFRSDFRCQKNQKQSVGLLCICSSLTTDVLFVVFPVYLE